MARRSDHSRAELYEMALAASRKIVESEGIRALTARHVANSIGYSPGTLYNLFDNLDDMVIHLNGRTLDDLHDRLITGELTGIPENDLKNLLGEYLDFLEENRNLWGALFEFSLSGGQRLPDWFLKKVNRVLCLVENALLPLFPAGESSEVGQAARILWASLHGICTLSDAGKLEIVTSQTVRAMAYELLANFVAGLKVNHG